MVVPYMLIVVVFGSGGDSEIGGSFAAGVALLTWGVIEVFRCMS